MRILLPGMRGVGGQGTFADGAKAPAPVAKMDVDEEEVVLSRSPKKEKKDKKDKKDKEGRKSKKVKADPDSE